MEYRVSQLEALSRFLDEKKQSILDALAADMRKVRGPLCRVQHAGISSTAQVQGALGSSFFYAWSHSQKYLPSIPCSHVFHFLLSFMEVWMGYCVFRPGAFFSWVLYPCPPFFEFLSIKTGQSRAPGQKKVR